MNLKEVIEESRILLNEVSHNINQGYSDSIVQDRTIVLAINECVTEIESRLGLKNISYEDTDYNINLISQTDIYKFPDGVNSIRDLIITNGNQKYYLTQKPYEDIQYSIDIKGIPSYYALDYKTGYIKLSPIVNQDSLVLKFIGRVNNAKITLDDIDREMPFESRYHMAFIYYVCNFVCENLIDVDNTQKSRGVDYLRKFNNELLKYKNDIIQNRYTPNGIYFDNDRYNT